MATTACATACVYYGYNSILIKTDDPLIRVNAPSESMSSSEPMLSFESMVWFIPFFTEYSN